HIAGDNEENIDAYKPSGDRGDSCVVGYNQQYRDPAETFDIRSELRTSLHSRRPWSIRPPSPALEGLRGPPCFSSKPRSRLRLSAKWVAVPRKTRSVGCATHRREAGRASATSCGS